MSDLRRLWDSAKPQDRRFDAARLAEAPEPARRYLSHAIAQGTPLASAVRLSMHGEIKLKTWSPFRADEVICWGKGFVWKAGVKMGRLSVSGSDRFIDGRGAMRWSLFGLLPLVRAYGPDVTRSAAGRMNLESIWLPSAVCAPDVRWTSDDASRAHASFSAHGETAEIDYDVRADGSLAAVGMQRWGNPGGRAFELERCGGLIEREETIGGYTIPTRVRVGWYFGTSRFETDGEFFRVAIDTAEYK